MKHLYGLVLLLNIFFFLLASQIKAQIRINEICSSNNSIISNTNGNYDDWIEIYNSGSSALDLNGYGLSDDSTKLYAFRFPHVNINPGNYILLFASSKDNTDLVNHWESAVKSGNTWKYLPVVSTPDTNWRNLSFNDASWSSGNGGIGFGDGDDATVIPHCRTMYMRKSFNIPDTSKISKCVFQMDYNDGFVAYLNGVEIARANVGVKNIRPSYNDFAHEQHMPLFNQGLLPDSFYIDPVFLKSFIKQGTNVLSIEVHEYNDTLFHMSSLPYLSFGMRNSGTTFSSTPSWFKSSTDHFNANFKLSKTGETLFLTNPSGTRIDTITFPALHSDNSYGRIPDGSNSWCYIQKPSPDSTNNGSPCTSAYASVPVFSLPGGFYTGTQSLTLILTQPGGQIRYTTNGSDPKSNSTLYAGPISINATKNIKARIFANGLLPSPVVSNTFFINETVHLPVFSLVADSSDLFDQNTGIYATGLNADTAYPYLGANYWQDWEKPVSIEYYTPDKNLAFSLSSLMKIAGGDSRTLPQKSFEIKLSSAYGASTLNYSLIPDKSYLNTWSDFIIRNAGTDWEYAHMRDAVEQRVMKNTFIEYNGFQECVVFLNGSFWGIYEIRENNDHRFAEENDGVNKNQLDYLDEKGPITVKVGNDSAFYSMIGYVSTANHTDTSFYNTMDQLWDLKNFTDYFVVETYDCNEDWIGPWNNNIIFWRARTNDGKWKQTLNDLDAGFGLFSHAADNMLDTAMHPLVPNFQTDILNALLENPDYKRYFINRYADLINTNFLPSNIIPLINATHDSMAFDMPRQWSKWGPVSTGSVGAWNNSISIMKNFVNGRTPFARNYVQSEFGLTSQVNLTLKVQPAGAGRIQISTVTPLTYPWSGVYFNGNPVTITAIPNPGYTFNYWHSDSLISHDTNESPTYNFTTDDIITAHFNGSPITATITISEFNYNSDSAADAGDWIELHNFGSTDMDISGWKLKDEMDNHQFIFPVSTVIAPNGYLVVASDLTKFHLQHPSVSNVIGPMNFSLSSTGEQIRLFQYNDSLFLSFYYETSSPWPPTANGGGYTCERIGHTNDPNDGASWFAGCLGGSPGRAYSAPSYSVTLNGSQIFCTGDSVSLVATNHAGYVYQWQRNHINLPGETSNTLYASLDGSYTLELSYQGCTLISDSTVLAVLQHGQMPVITPGSHCGPGTINLSATGNDTIYWYDAPNGNLLHTGNSFTTPNINSTTTYTVQSGKLCPGPNKSITATIIPVTSTPVVSDTSVCGPQALTLHSSDTATVHWYNASSGGTLLFTGYNFPTPYLNTNTNYYVEAGSVCPSARVALHVTIVVTQAPTVTPAARCGPGSLVLHASSSDSLFWYDASSGGNLIHNGPILTTPVIAATTTYYVDANGGCPSIRVPVTAIINSVSAQPITSDGFSCGPGNVLLSGISSDSISWYNQPANGTLLGTGATFLTSLLNTTTTYYAIAGYVCPSPPVATVASIYPIPHINLGNDTIITSGTSLNLNAGSGFVSYQWSNGDTTQSSLVQTSDTFSVSVTDANGCSTSDTIAVTFSIGVQQIKYINQVILYPNPSTGKVNIFFESRINKCRLEISNVLSQVVYKEDLQNITAAFVKEIDLNVPGGTYMLRIISDNGSIIKSFIIK